MDNKNLVYFQQWIPAGQQMDKYSSNPWMLLSKNADIFSSSNSYKATAWSTPDSQASWVVDTDDKGRFILYANWDVVDTSTNPATTIVNVVTHFSDVAFPVNYVWHSRSTGSYTTATFWTPKKLIVKYDWDDPQEIVVFSDRMKYVYSYYNFNKAKYVDVQGSNCNAYTNSSWDIVIDTMTNKDFWVRFNIDAVGFYNTTFKVDYWTAWTWTLDMTRAVLEQPYLYYDKKTDSMQFLNLINSRNLTYTQPSPRNVDDQIPIETPVFHQTWLSSNQRVIELRFKITTDSTVNSSNPRWWTIMVFEHISHHEYYGYLPLDESRTIKDIWEYYFVSWDTFPSLYYFSSTWEERDIATTPYVIEQNVPVYNFEQYMWYEIDPAMTCVDCVVFDEKVYLICNKDWNWYIFPCDLSWGKGTPYIAYWVEFKSAIVLNYLIYLVWENRWVSSLFAYSWTELVHIIEGNKKIWQTVPYSDHIDTTEQYKFNGMIADWRWVLVLGTNDNRIFAYWQTWWGRWGSFIHDLGSSKTLKEIRTIWKDLYVKYTENNVVKTIKYQNDVSVKNYNTNYEIVYPVTIGSHLIEKEVYDLTCSYILPSSNCKLEFYVAANQYTYWTFTGTKNITLDPTKQYKANFLWGNYYFEFIEKDWNYDYTFRLVWDMPYQFTWDDELVQPYYDRSWGTPVLIDDIEDRFFLATGDTWLFDITWLHHFRKLGEITSEWYEEKEYRFVNINTRLQCPRTHSLQLMVRWTGTANYTPEVFGVNLVANQRSRW